MEFNDLLHAHGYDPEHVILFRHLPREPDMRNILPWLAAEKPHHYNAYQSTQRDREQKAMAAEVGQGYVASFIGHEPGKALFVGLYAVRASTPLTYEQFWDLPEHQFLKQFGMWGWKEDEPERHPVLLFDLLLLDFYPNWKGRLIIDWPGGGRAWYRRAHRGSYPVAAVKAESILSLSMPG